MQFLKIAGANCTLAEDQDEYETIYVRMAETPLDYGNGDVRMVPCITAELKPTREEIEHLREGGSLFLNILGRSWPPLSVTATDPTLISEAKGNA